MNIESLAVGEKGLISAHRLGMCKTDGQLKVYTTSGFEENPSEYFTHYEIKKLPNEKVSIKFSKKGKTPDEDSLIESILSISYSRQCSFLEKTGVKTYHVESFFGFNSLDKIIEDLTIGNQEISVNEDTKTEKEDRFEKNENQWVVNKSKSLIDDSPKIIITKQADNGSQTLVLRCKENKTDVYIVTGDYLTDDNTKVTIRVDDDQAVNRSLSLSTDNKALFFRYPIANINKWMESKKLVLRYTSYSGREKTLLFSLDGLKDKIGPLRKACHW